MGLVRLASKFAPQRRANWESVRRLVPNHASGIEVREDGDGNVVLFASVANRSGVIGKLARAMKRDDAKRYELEPIGAYVWSMIDGKRNLESLCTAIRSHFGLGKKEAEVSLIAFLQLLTERGLIHTRGPKA